MGALRPRPGAVPLQDRLADGLEGADRDGLLPDRHDLEDLPVAPGQDQEVGAAAPRPRELAVVIDAPSEPLGIEEAFEPVVGDGTDAVGGCRGPRRRGFLSHHFPSLSSVV